MTDDPSSNPAPVPPLQQVQHASATARVPDQIGRGVFATGVIVLRGPNEYAIDFVQSLARPSRVAARVVLPPIVASQFVIALEQAIEKYTATFGQPPQEPRPVPPPAGGLPPGSAGEPGSAGGQPVAPPQPALEQGAAQPAPARGAGGAGGGPPGGAAPAAPQPVVPPPPPQPPIAEVYETLKLPDEMLGGTYANMASITHTASEFCFDFIAQFFPRSAVTARVYMAAPRALDLLGSLKRSIGGR